MPRIPVRTEPYDSPSRQHRHYKNKRDQVLRTLGKASYINSSQFLLLMVTATGIVETYASDAFQGAMPRWLEDSGMAHEAKQLVLERAAHHGPPKYPSPEQDDQDDDLSDEEGAEEPSSQPRFVIDNSQTPGDDTPSAGAPGQSFPSPHSSGPSSSQTCTPLIKCDDVFGGGTVSTDAPSESKPVTSLLPPSPSGLGASRLNRKQLSPLDIDTANKPFAGPSSRLDPSSAQDDRFFRAPKSAPLPNTNKSSTVGSSSELRSLGNKLPARKITLQDRKMRTAFLELRFSQMQQSMCKTVAKAWIKIIEPKKQTRCPYNKGEEGKPAWWPEGVRHKEPDHLMKPERHALLLTILRSPKIEVSRLRLATAEVVAMIRADRVDLLLDCYRVAQAEEKLRKEGHGDAEDQPVTVAVSSFEGWREGQGADKGGLDEHGQRVTMGDDVPEGEEKRKTRPLKKGKGDATADVSVRLGKKKRKTMTPGPDGASPSGSQLRPETALGLQRSTSTPGPLTGADYRQHEHQRVLAQANQQWSGDNAAEQARAEAHARAEASRRQVASNAVDSAVSAGLLYGNGGRMQFSMFDQHMPAFNQPMSASSAASFFDYNFAPDQRLEHMGTMSAPQGQHAQLYPEQHTSMYPHQHQQQQQQQQQLSDPNSSLVHGDQFSYPANFAFHGFDPNGNGFDGSGGPSGALGLQGIPDDASQNINWSASFDSTGPGFVVNTGWAGTSGGDAAQQFSVPGTAPARLAALPDVSSADDSVGDSTMDRSFNTTISSVGGPATPPGCDSQDLSQQSQAFAKQEVTGQQQQQQQQQPQYSALSGFYDAQNKSRTLGNAFSPSAWPTSDTA